MKDKSPKKNVVERYFFTKDEFEEIERTILIQEHLKRYGTIRRFCYGDVIDVACGCGYGTYMVSVNPDVKSVKGVDIDSDAIEWARNNFLTDKISYENNNVASVQGKFDTLVCIETIEHVKERGVIPDLVERCSIDNLIVSFPDKKTTHYNKHHFHDFVEQEIIDLFPKHIVYHSMRFMDSTIVLFTRSPQKAPPSIYRNIRDLN